MHRNYQTNAPAKFYEYSDRIEMDNPGNLYGKVSPDNFPTETDYRNPVIAVAMKTLGYVNQFGKGIEMVQEELETNKNGLAKFKFDDITTFKAIVMNADLEAVERMENDTEMIRKNDTEKINQSSNIQVDSKNIAKKRIEKDTEKIQKRYRKDTEKLTDNEMDIISLIVEKNTVSRKTIAQKLNISTATVSRNIESLKEKGILERIGGDRGGYWKINQ